MAESVRLESLTKPSTMERSRIRSIRMVAGDLESKLQEIDAQKEQQEASKVRKVQERSAPEVKASAISTSSTGGDITEKVIAVVPSSAQPLTLDNLMAGIAQSTGAILPVADRPRAHPPPKVQAKQSSTQPQVELRETQHGAESQSQVISGAESGTQALSLLDVPSPPSTGRRSQRPDPSPMVESTQEPSMEPVESSRERQRKPSKELCREKRSSHDRERTPDSARVRSKELRKAEKHRKKESKHRRRSESDRPEKPHTRRDERSRSSKRPEPQPERQEETPQAEVSATDDPTPKGGSRLAIKDKPPRAPPRFDPTVEHAVGRRVAEKSARSRLAQQQQQRGPRESSADGVPTREEEEERRRRPPMPPPASTSGALRLRSRNHPPPPPRADATTDSATSTPRNRLRLRPREGDNPPQRTMPRRTASTPIGGAAQQQPLATPQRQPLTEYHGQSRLREDRALRWEQSGEGREQRDYSERSRSRQWQDDQQWTEQPWHGQERQTIQRRWGSTQTRTPGTTYRDAGSQQGWRDQQDSSYNYRVWSQQAQDRQLSQTSTRDWQAPQQGQQSQYSAQAQYWPAQQQQQSQQQQTQLPPLPAPVFPPGMQSQNVQAPPGLGAPNAQQQWQGNMTKTTPFQFGSAATRQQSPFGLQTQGSAADRQRFTFWSTTTTVYWKSIIWVPVTTPSISLRGSVLTREKTCIHVTSGIEQFMHGVLEPKRLEILTKESEAVRVIEPGLPRCTRG